MDLRPPDKPALHAQAEAAYNQSTLPTSSPANNPYDWLKRTETEHSRPFTYDELVSRDKVSLDIIWLQDESLEDSENLPAPGVIAAEIVDELEAALTEFRAVAEMLGSGEVGTEPSV